MHDLDGVLRPSLAELVERHVNSLATWDILVFFHAAPAAALDVGDLAKRLGRRSQDVEAEVATLCASGILSRDGGTIRYCPDAEMRAAVGAFCEACHERDRRLAILAMVLHKANATPR